MFYQRCRLRLVGCGVLLALLGLPAENWADQVIEDDLIVEGSACIGRDCEENEIFNSDTLRLEANVLRIHFNDTSSLPGFPRRDWRIFINDRLRGGIGRFSITDVTGQITPFTIRADAVQDSLYIARNPQQNPNSFRHEPRVGIGTRTPRTELHLVSANTAEMTFEQTAEDGFPPQIWQVEAHDENFTIRDETNNTRPFRVNTNAPNNSLLVEDTGDVSIVGVLNQGSSRQLKDKIVPLDGRHVLDKVAALPVSEWSYTHDTETRHIGPMAEDFHAAFGLGKDDTHLAPADTAGVALVAVQELTQLVKTLQQHNAELQARLEDVEQQLGQVKGEKEVK